MQPSIVCGIMTEPVHAALKQLASSSGFGSENIQLKLIARSLRTCTGVPSGTGPL